jgi:hypothetical protein
VQDVSPGTAKHVANEEDAHVSILAELLVQFRPAQKLVVA